MVNRKEHPNETPKEREKRERLNKYHNERLKRIDWYCDVCQNGKNYTYRGKGMHLRTKKHDRNLNKTIFAGSLIEL